MEIITTASAATTAKSNHQTTQNTMANVNYSKSLMASRALANSATNSEVSIANLEKGDVFKGEITNITGRNVTVSLGSGQVLTATLLENVPINIGNQLYFEVKENNGQQVVIRPLLDEKFSPMNQTIEKALQSAGLQVNEKNMAVVKELMNASMPIDRNTIMKVLQQLVNYPSAGVNTIVNMMRCEIPINEVSVSQFRQYMEHNYQLNSQVDELMNQVVESFENLGSNNTFAGEIVRLNQLFVDTFTTPVDQEPLPTMPLSEAFAMDDAEVMAYAAPDDLLAMDAEGKVIYDANGNAYPAGSLLMNADGSISLDRNGQPMISEEFLNQLLENNPEMTKEEAIKAFQNGEFNVEISRTFSNEIQARFASRLKALGITDDVIKSMLSPDHSTEQLLKSIQDFIKNDPHLSDDAIKQFLSSREYTVLLETVMSNHWKLTPEQLKSPSELEHLFDRMAQQSRQLADAGASFSESGGNFSEQSRNMNENLQFMEMLNEKYTFAQVPVLLNNQDVNSELYVYTNKKSLSKEKKDISCLLHLDMDHLGSTDVHVKLNGKNVMVRFYMEDNRSFNTVKSHIDQLAAKISLLGLTLETEVVRRQDGKKEEVDDFVKDFLAKDIPSNQQVKRYTFDMRA